MSHAGLCRNAGLFGGDDVIYLLGLTPALLPGLSRPNFGIDSANPLKQVSRSSCSFTNLQSITPLAAGERRVSLTFEYVTDRRMRPWRRFVSNMKDAVAYFGFRQVFRRGSGGA